MIATRNPGFLGAFLRNLQRPQGGHPQGLPIGPGPLEGNTQKVIIAAALFAKTMPEAKLAGKFKYPQKLMRTTFFY